MPNSDDSALSWAGAEAGESARNANAIKMASFIATIIAPRAGTRTGTGGEGARRQETRPPMGPA